ncbi:MAG: hypothetical protein LBE01_03150, partial [Deltaproteobacteria bacterium]|nr:hypothetical protein [Deltaproteobacteria bacterium]
MTSSGLPEGQGPQGAIKTLITTHLNPDFDGVASMVAASRLYPDGVLVFPGGQEKSIRNYFIQSLLYLLNVVRAKDVDLKEVEL